MTNLSLWILLFPLLGFLILGLMGRFMSRAVVRTVAWSACGLAFLFAVFNLISDPRRSGTRQRSGDIYLDGCRFWYLDDQLWSIT